MVIFLKSGGRLQPYLKPDVDQYTRRVEIEDGLSLEEILDRLGIPRIHVAFAFSCGSFRQLSYRPTDGEIITLQPPVAGG